jgi:hypothetical protein
MSDITLREGEFGTRTIKAVGGLHFIRSNGLPYFTLTIVGHGESGPAHEELVRCWPELQPLADMHLSDINGVPMHTEANGWYWLAGAAGPRFGSAIDGGRLGQKYHGACGRTDAECLEIFARHVRISLADAKQLLGKIRRAHYVDPAKARLQFNDWILAQKPRWKAEADACIKALDLQVFGDRWAPEEMPA